MISIVYLIEIIICVHGPILAYDNVILTKYILEWLGSPLRNVVGSIPVTSKTGQFAFVVFVA